MRGKKLYTANLEKGMQQITDVQCPHFVCFFVRLAWSTLCNTYRQQWSARIQVNGYRSGISSKWMTIEKAEHEQQQSKKWFNLMIFMYNILNCWFYFVRFYFCGGMKLYFYSTNIYCICWINPTTNTFRISKCKLIWMRCAHTTMAKNMHIPKPFFCCIATIASRLAHFSIISLVWTSEMTTNAIARWVEWIAFCLLLEECTLKNLFT